MPALEDLPDLLTTPELARLLRTTTNSVNQDRYLGRGVPFIRVGRRRILYAKTDVIRYLEENRLQRTDDPPGLLAPSRSGGSTSTETLVKAAAQAKLAELDRGAAR